MNFSIEISSDSDNEQEVPFAARVAQKAFVKKQSSSDSKKKPSPKRRKVFSSAFSDSDSELDLPSPPPRTSVLDAVSITPPPDYISPSYKPIRDRNSPPPSNSVRIELLDTDELPDTDELVSVKSHSSSSSFGLSKKSSSETSLFVDNDKHGKGYKKTKVDKELEKQKKQEEKLKKQQAKDFERQNSKVLKEAEKNVSKQTDKAEVHKYIMVVIDPHTVSSPPGSEILNLLRNPPDAKEESVFQFSVEKLPVSESLTWKRKIISYEVTGGQVQILEQWQEEGRALIFMSATDLAAKVASGSLRAWTVDAKRKFGGKHITLMVYNYKAYFKTEKNAKERVRKAMVRGDNPTGKDLQVDTVSHYKMEEALVSLSIDRVADHLTFDKATDKGWRDCGGSVFHQTRAVAEAPLKLKKGLSGSAGFSFWAKADCKDCVAPKNLPEYWKQVLMQVSSGVGLEKASAIASKFPSPTELMRGYSRCSSIKECEELLANVEVRRTDNILGGTRKVGPDISRRIHMALTATDPNQFLTKM